MKKILFTTIAALLLSAAAFSQDYDDYAYEPTSSPAVTVNGEAGAKGRAWAGHYDEDDEWNSSISSQDNIKNIFMEGSAYGLLDVNYTGDVSDVNVKLKADTSTIKDYPEDILEEATVRGYFGNWVVSGGKMKIVWGKGDKLHVLDNFNANDYTDFIFPEYIDRRLAEPMFSLAYSAPNASNIRLELVATPMMTADRFATSGALVPNAQKELTSTVQNIVITDTLNTLNDGGLTVNGSNVTVSSDAFSAISDASSFSSDDLFENNIKSLKYAQGGARLTGTFSSIDWGFSYYYGHFKQPSPNFEKYIDSISTYAASTEGQTYISQKYSSEITAKTTEILASGVTSDASTAATLAYQAIVKEYASDLAKQGVFKVELPSLDYDRLQTFGFELATVIWKFNTRAELAYNLTEDVAGDNPWVKNNSIAWVGGFDMDLPIHNLNVNIQETGTFVLNSDKIKDGDYAVYDVDYNSDDNYCINKLVVNVSDKWLHEKLTTECTAIYGIENKEWCVQPKIEYNPSEGLFLTLSGAYLFSNNENGEFYNFTADSTKSHRKMFGQIAVKYTF